MTTRAEQRLRAAIVEAMGELGRLGINQGTSGNIGARCDDRLLVTPSGIPAADMRPADIVPLPLTAAPRPPKGAHKPSSEWRIHHDILRARPEVGAVVHAHPPYATALAMARRDIPAAHYMIAAAGGPSVRCAAYATFGTAELSKNVLTALEERTCCLMANHGILATGADLAKAMWLAVELETLARQYLLSLTIGGPVLLDEAEIERNVNLFKGYGPKRG